MGALLSVGIKQQDGTYKNYTIGVNDDTNQWGNTCSVWEQQTKEEREAKTPKNYCGNGKVVWTDGKAVAAEWQDKATAGAKKEESDLPF